MTLAGRAPGLGTTRGVPLLLAALALLVGLVALGTTLGSVSIPLSSVWGATWHVMTGEGAQGVAERIAWDVRVPRVLLAVLVGASLGASGAVTQAVFRNPLAEPYLLGISSGATFGVTVWVVLTGGLRAGSDALAWQGWQGLAPVFAFTGGLLAVAATLTLARGGALSRSEGLLLSGIAVSGVLHSSTAFLVLRDADRLRTVFSWMLGNLALAGWRELGILAPYAGVALGATWLLARGLDALQLGDDTAHTLGIPVERTRLLAIGVATLATGAAVAFVGTIGFIGLVAPHLVRMLGGATHRLLLPASAVAGACLLVAADLGARTLVSPAELPVGIVLTWVGGLFFLWLSRRK